MKWSLIETAPKDGTNILGWREGSYDVCAAHKTGWANEGCAWLDNDAWVVEPTHWQPLPPPPTAQLESNDYWNDRAPAPGGGCAEKDENPISAHNANLINEIDTVKERLLEYPSDRLSQEALREIERLEAINLAQSLQVAEKLSEFTAAQADLAKCREAIKIIEQQRNEARSALGKEP